MPDTLLIYMWKQVTSCPVVGIGIKYAGNVQV